MAARAILIAGNWKMNRGPAGTRDFFEGAAKNWNTLLTETSRSALKSGALQACLCIPSLSMVAALDACAALPIKIGSQNTHWEESGAFTGEVSGPMLTELGIQTSLTGHSERRQYFGETDETTGKRTSALLEQGFRVILCVGETRQEREAGQTEAVVTRQILAVLGGSQSAAEGAHNLKPFLNGRLVIAYEPVWAIGTGLTASPEQAEEAHQMIRSLLATQYGAEAANQTLILYGGSVSPQNVEKLLACPNVDGALVGGASVAPDSFLQLLEAGGQRILTQ